MSQNKDGFYDEYDQNLRNLPGGDGSGEEERYRLYQIPSKKKNNFPVTPKKVGKFYDPIAGIPGAGNLDSMNQGGAPQQQQLGPQQDSFINPVTGEINYEAAQNSLTEGDRKREQKEKEKKKFVEEKTYEESKFRRFQIVFFLTLPAALAVSIGAASAIEAGLIATKVAGGANFATQIGGSLVMIFGTLGLSSANAYQDMKKLDEHKKQHGTEWKDEDYDFYNLEEID